MGIGGGLVGKMKGYCRNSKNQEGTEIVNN